MSAINSSRKPRNVSAEIGPVNNDGQEVIATSEPYIVRVTLVGTADMLFHRWNVEEVAAKASAAKGSKAKKSDNVESYCYRNDAGEICVPGEYLRMAVINAAKYKQDPRSPRKSAMDLYKAGIVSLTILSSLGKHKWDYEHKCRVMIQRNGITRTRPAMKAGWEAKFDLQVLLPEYVRPDDLSDVVTNAGRLVGLGDFRPTYGRFRIARFEIVTE